MPNINDIINAQITLCGSKLAAEKMTSLVSGVELSILSILYILGETDKEIVYKIIERDYTTTSHCITSLRKKGYISERAVPKRRKRYVKLLTAGTAIYTQYIIATSKKSAEMEKLMPKTHIEKKEKGGDNQTNG